MEKGIVKVHIDHRIDFELGLPVPVYHQLRTMTRIKQQIGMQTLQLSVSAGDGLGQGV